MTESQKIRITQIANIVAEQNNVSLPEGARPTGLDRLAYVLEHGAGITPEGGRTALGRLFDCFKSGKVAVSDEAELPASIEVKTMPTKVAYTVGDTLDTAGLELTLTYNTGDTRTLTAGFTATPTALETEGTQEILVSYTEKDVTVTCTFDVTVAAAVVEEPEENTPESEEE